MCVRLWMAFFQEFYNLSIRPAILINSLQCDLPYRDVEQTDIESLCKENDFIGWTETSVKDGLMIEESMR